MPKDDAVMLPSLEHPLMIPEFCPGEQMPPCPPFLDQGRRVAGRGTASDARATHVQSANGTMPEVPKVDHLLVLKKRKV